MSFNNMNIRKYIKKLIRKYYVWKNEYERVIG